MRKSNWRARILPTLMMAGVVSLLLSLVLGGFIFYQWVLAFEATAASLVMLVFYVRDYGGGARDLIVANPAPATILQSSDPSAVKTSAGKTLSSDEFKDAPVNE